ncbi:MAG TPA: hypothetical protein VLA89_05990 [Gemmatimonadales bacterium]|nr:hypothetical protein [Gemmatimonadales bacterium]
MSSLKGKVVGVVWQDIWWDPEERSLDSYPDEKYIHMTYGLVLRDTKEWLSVAHEVYPKRGTACGVTSIYKPVILEIKDYGDSTIESRVQKAKRKR